MKNNEVKATLERYNQRLRKYGSHPNTLGWTKGKHTVRFQVFMEKWNLDNSSILDFGCGFGDFYGYLKKNNLNIDYLGVDINENLINLGMQKYPQAKFLCANLLENDVIEMYDFCFSSGVHNFLLENNIEFIRKTFELLNKHSRVGFALNFLSNRVDYTDENIYYSSPTEILAIAYEFSNRVMLRNDYMPFEFTVYVDTRKDFDKKHVVYNEYLKFVENSCHSTGGWNP
jgi:SAM-dependent methyltransferase